MSVAVAPWKKRLLGSLSQNKELANSRYVQLATVKPDGRPANRTVVFRGFLEDGEDLTFVTDKRSNKVLDVAANPACEVCWYFPRTREQYRLSGNLTIVDHTLANERLQAARQLAWSKMSDSGRTQFMWPHPGLPRDKGPDSAAAFNQPAPGPKEPAVDTFCLVVLTLEEVEQLKLFDNQRRSYTKRPDGQGGFTWDEQDINP